jgi:aminopeptidase N
MLEAYLGEDTFRGGIRQYVQAHKYGNATTADLWIALSAASKKDVSALAKAWTEQPGFPLVSVTAACDASGKRTVTMAQKRFLLDGTTDTANLKWNVPVALASGNAEPAYVMLTDAQQSGIPAGRCSEPLRANAGGIGYYRVAYDPATFATNRAAFASLPDSDKIAMLGDQWNLVRIGAAPLPSFLALSSAMGDNRNTRAWQDIVAPLAQLESYMRGLPQHDAFAAYARKAVAPLFASLGWDAKPGETVATGELRRTVISALGAWGDQAIIAEARTRFDRAVADPTSTTPEMQGVLTGIVATNADVATFDRLHQLALNAKDPTLAARYRGSLMHVRDPQLAARALEIAMSNEVPPQQTSSRFGYIATATDWNPKLAWTVFQANSDTLTKRFSLFEKMLTLSNAVPQIFWDAATPDQLEAWLKKNLPPTANEYITKGLTRAKTNGAIRDRLREDVRAFLASGAVPAT